MSERPVGLTQDVGWQIGVSRTFDIGPEAAWEYLVSPAGLGLWLGEGIAAPLKKTNRYTTTDGTSGEVRSFRPGERMRLTWHPAGRDEPATVQVTVRPSARGCSVRFHTEHLSNEQDREAMRRHWSGALDRLGNALASSTRPRKGHH